MTERVFERRTRTAILIFNLEDGYARARLGPRSHPRPYEPLRFWLVAREGPGLREVYPSPRELVITRNGSGYHLFFGEVWLADGAARRERGVQLTNQTQRPRRQIALSGGTYRVRVTSPLYQTLEQVVALPQPNPNQRDPGNPDPALRDPMAAYTLTLQPGYGYPFPDAYPIRLDDPDECPEPPPGRRGPTLLYGSMYTTGGRGVTGADVQVQNLTERCSIDKSGQWVLWFPEPPPNGPDALASGPVTVQFRLPGNPPLIIDVPNVCVVRGCATSLGQAALRGWVLWRGVGVAGATVAISGQAPPVTTDGQGGWSYYFDLNQPAADTLVSVTVTLPDGTSQTQAGIGVRRRATVMVPAFNFT